MTEPTTPHPRRSVISRVTRPIEVLPMRVRLVALLVSLLLVALTLTSFATSALMRRQLMDNADRDLVAAAVPTASRLVRSLGDKPIHRLDAGQSTAMVALRNVGFGVSNENQWWGPGIRNALILSNNAPGFPHAFIRTEH